MTEFVCPICGNKMTQAKTEWGDPEGFECVREGIWISGDELDQDRVVWWTEFGWLRNGGKKFTNKEEILRWWKLRSFE